MSPFDPQHYGPAVAAVLNGERRAPLDAGQPNRAARGQLEALPAETLFGSPSADDNMLKACLAALWLWHDFLDESHSISQEIDTPTGSFWHAIMHRREGDFGNAKYWFRRVRRHPVFRPLAAAAKEEAASSETALSLTTEFTGGGWDPFLFVDLCERTINSRDANDEDLLRRIARREWQLLFDHCYRAANGSA